MPLIPALGGRGRRMSEFEASLPYKVSVRTARATQIELFPRPQQNPNKTKHKQMKALKALMRL